MEWKATSDTAAEFYSAVILSDLHVLMNSSLVIHTTHVSSSLFSNCHVRELACFYEPQFSRNSLNISLSDYVLKTKNEKKLQEKVLNCICQTNSVCKLLQIVDFDGF